MSTLPKPITKEGYRMLNTLAYEKRVLEDGMMRDVQSLINFGRTVFEGTQSLVDLTDVDSIKADAPKITLPQGFIPIDQTAVNFYLGAKPHNGLRSLRRGHYQLLPVPTLIPVLDFKVWSMDVLFSEGPGSDIIYKYKCNVGPLVNKFAVCRDLTSRQFLQLPVDGKKQALEDLTKRVIYVSSAELIQIDETFKPYESKEVLWFVW